MPVLSNGDRWVSEVLGHQGLATRLSGLTTWHPWFRHRRGGRCSPLAVAKAETLGMAHGRPSGQVFLVSSHRLIP